MIFSLVFIVSFLFFRHALSASPSEKSCYALNNEGSYSYDIMSKTGPADWHRISGYELCGTGSSQSPIDFPSHPNITDLFKGGPTPSMKEATYEMHSKTENWAVDCKEKQTCGYTIFKGEKFYVLGMHFHTPSEHTLNGKKYPLEGHIVHQSEAGNLAVISTMFEYSDNNTYSTMIYNKKPREHGINYFLKKLWTGLLEKKQKEVTMDLRSIVKTNQGVCTYSGSLTTPPCSENVWFLMQLKVQKVSKQQVHAYFGSVGYPLYGNNRPLQDLNNRQVLCYV